MAFATRDTLIANPAHGPHVRRPAVRKAKKKNMAKPKRRLTLKQKLHFGSARQRAAAKASLRAKRHNAAKRHAANRPKARKTSHRNRTRTVATRRHNPGQIIPLVFGNPSRRRRKKTMAKPKARRHNAGVRRHHSAGISRHHNVRRHNRRRHNPGRLDFGGMLKEGLAVIGGAAGSKILTQAVLSTSNTGVMGYLGNAVSTGILAWATGAFLKSKELTQGVILGGVVQIILRVIGDYSLLGSYSSQLGLGDYMVSNWPVPLTLPDALASPMARIPAGWGAPPLPVVASAPGTAGMTGMGDYARGALY